MSKSAEAFRTISEVAGDLDVPKHVLRFWEVKFPQIRPMKRGGGRRYYRPEDLVLLRGIQHLLHAEGYTIKGVQKILREQGVEQVKVHGLAVPATRHTRSASKDKASVMPAAASGRVRALPKHVRPKDHPAAATHRHAIETALRELEACRETLMAPFRTIPAVRSAEPRRARAARSPR